MSAHHHPADCDQVHDRDTDVSERRSVTPRQAAIVRALGHDVSAGGTARLTLRQWRQVEELAHIATSGPWGTETGSSGQRGRAERDGDSVTAETESA